MSKKKFEKELHDRFDRSTKEIAVNFLESTGQFKLLTSLDKQPECYKDSDFYITFLPTNRSLRVEVERKVGWIREKVWQFTPAGIHVASRKKDSRSELFVMVNRSGKTLMFTYMNTVKSSPLVKKNTMNRITGTRTVAEEFFEIPLTDPTVDIYTYVNNVWSIA